MAHTEKTIESQTLYQGKIIEVRKDKAELENGQKATRELVVHHGGVGVAAIDSQDRILLVKQFRYAPKEELLEIPAGKKELGEDPRECGIRELEEECGCRAGHFEKLTEIYPTPAYCTEVTYIYYAEDLQETSQNLDQGEFLDVLRIDFNKALEMVLSGEIKDAKTQVAILNLAAKRAAK